MTPQLIAYLNGSLLPASEAVLPLADVGFVWGATVVERLRTFRQKLFRLDDHLHRFRDSCERACIPQPLTDGELLRIAHDLVETNARQLDGRELSLAVFATPGDGLGKPTLGMQAEPLAFARYAPLFREGAFLTPVPCANPLDPTIKHRSRLAWWIAKERLPAGCEPLFVSSEPPHFVRETSIANFLAVIDGKLVSPPRSTVLCGISLRVVEELVESLGIPFVERELPLAEVATNATECLLTSTSFCIAPVARVTAVVGMENRVFSPAAEGKNPLNDPAGPTFRRLLQAWNDLVGVDILLQFLTNR